MATQLSSTKIEWCLISAETSSLSPGAHHLPETSAHHPPDTAAHAPEIPIQPSSQQRALPVVPWQHQIHFRGELGTPMDALLPPSRPSTTSPASPLSPRAGNPSLPNPITPTRKPQHSRRPPGRFRDFILGDDYLRGVTMYLPSGGTDVITHFLVPLCN